MSGIDETTESAPWGAALSILLSTAEESSPEWNKLKAAFLQLQNDRLNKVLTNKRKTIDALRRIIRQKELDLRRIIGQKELDLQKYQKKINELLSRIRQVESSTLQIESPNIKHNFPAPLQKRPRKVARLVPPPLRQHNEIVQRREALIVQLHEISFNIDKKPRRSKKFWSWILKIHF
jgi:uncharacterized coiled-coil protein SlyX